LLPEKAMKLTPTLVSALLCGAVLGSLPAFAAGAGGTAGGGIGAGPTTGAAGTSTGTGVNTTGQIATPAGAVNKNSSANANAAAGMSKGGDRLAAGPSASTGGLSNNGGDMNNATAGNNAGSVDMSTQTPSKRMSRKVQANASAAEEETTRQLNHQQAQLNEQSSAGKAANPKPPVQ
jgi:hypothetical protein